MRESFATGVEATLPGGHPLTRLRSQTWHSDSYTYIIIVLEITNKMETIFQKETNGHCTTIALWGADITLKKLLSESYRELYRMHFR